MAISQVITCATFIYIVQPSGKYEISREQEGVEMSEDVLRYSSVKHTIPNPGYEEQTDTHQKDVDLEKVAHHENGSDMDYV